MLVLKISRRTSKMTVVNLGEIESFWNIEEDA